MTAKNAPKNPSQRQVSPGKPSVRLPPPAGFSAEAATIWREVVAYLAADGSLMTVDAGTIETYALAVVRQRALSKALDAGGLVDKDGRVNPLLRVIEATATTVKNVGHCLRLNPTSRKTGGHGGRTAKGSQTWAGVLHD